MHFLVDTTEECASLARTSHELGKKLLSMVGPAMTIKKLTASKDLAQVGFDPKCFYVLRAGPIRFSLQNELLFLFEEGDLLNLDVHRDFAGCRMDTDFAIQVEEFSREQFLKSVMANAGSSAVWLEFLNSQVKLFMQLSASLVRGGISKETQLDLFETGKTIILQGAADRQVFTMVEGSADVLVDKVKVGEVKANEIFGALAALSGTPRTASVVARENCSVISLPDDQFVQLMKSRPETVLQLCRDMARNIVELNQKVVKLSRKLT